LTDPSLLDYGTHDGTLDSELWCRFDGTLATALVEIYEFCNTALSALVLLVGQNCGLSGAAVTISWTRMQTIYTKIAACVPIISSHHNSVIHRSQASLFGMHCHHCSRFRTHLRWLILHAVSCSASVQKHQNCLQLRNL